MWELYTDLERQFQDYIEYVPYLKDSIGGKKPKGNERVYSFKLLNLILSIGGYVDSVFKEMARYKDFIDPSCKENCKEILRMVRKGSTIPVYLAINAFEKEYTLSKRVVTFKCLPTHEDIIPLDIQRRPSKAWADIFRSQAGAWERGKKVGCVSRTIWGA